MGLSDFLIRAAVPLLVMGVAKVLVVDDDPQIRRVLKVILTGERYEVEDARSGESALLRLREFLPDLVLLALQAEIGC
jgi:CheY-like chemotaxis protein